MDVLRALYRKLDILYCHHHEKCYICPIASAETFQRLQEVLVDALGVDEDEVNIEASVQRDLEAESIDGLDVAFCIEKEFEFEYGSDERDVVFGIVGDVADDIERRVGQ